MINVPIKGIGIEVLEKFYSNGQPFYSLVAPDGGIITMLTMLDAENKAARARYVADCITEALAIGFKQGQAHVREALGIT